MSLIDDERRVATQTLMGAYMTLLSQRRYEEWIELWADDGIMEYPYAPAGRRRTYHGKADILAYIKHASGRVAADAVEHMRVFPMQDPDIAVLEMTIKGRAITSDTPYNQSFVIFFELRDGKLRRHREYWNPLVTMDAMGGREAWTSGFGFPEAVAA
jgi:ketosteroid isomerase-like protein